MNPTNSVLFGLMVIAPGILGVVITGFFLYKYERCRRNQSISRRIANDFLGPFSLLISKAETKECRLHLSRAYLSGGLAMLYGFLLVYWFG